jgi:hypothetical protein
VRPTANQVQQAAQSADANMKVIDWVRQRYGSLAAGFVPAEHANKTMGEARRWAHEHPQEASQFAQYLGG